MSTAVPSARPTLAMADSLEIQRDNFGDVLVRKGSGNEPAVARFGRLLHELDTAAPAAKNNLGCWVLLSLVGDSMAIHRTTMDLVTGQGASTYKQGGMACVEVNHPHGWRDRIVLSPRTWTLAARHGTLHVSKADRRRAGRMYRAWFPELPKVNAWDLILSDAAAWWYDRAPRNEFDHVTRTRPLQPLTRAACARRATLRPQLATATTTSPVEEDRFPEPLLGAPVLQDEEVLEQVLTDIRKAARDRRSRPAGRKACLESVDRALALVRGADAFHTLMGLRCVIVEGGLRGDTLAPRTLVNYVPAILMRLYRELAWLGPVYRPADEMHKIYETLIAQTAAGSRAHAGAFLGAFHRYLVILGAEPLLTPLSGGGPLVAPRARVLWPHELALALDFVDACALNRQVRLQVRFMLLLGCVLPLRPADFWSFRIEHVVGVAHLTMHVYTAVSDGSPKALPTRRPVDINDAAAAGAVLALHRLRLSQGAKERDRLLGHFDAGDGCFMRQATEAAFRAAVRWATGDPVAGIYDLRHTAITRLETRLADAAWKQQAGSDQVMNFMLLAASGQASRRSAESYIHDYETRVARVCAQARPSAWTPSEEFSRALQSLESVDHGLCGDRCPMEFKSARPPAATSAALTARERERITAYVLEDMPLTQAAALAFVEVEAVREQMQDLVQIAREAGLLDSSLGDSEAALGVSISLLKSWAPPAGTAKWAAVRAALHDLEDRGQWLTLERLWRDWRACANGASLALVIPRSASRIVDFLMGPGKLTKDQLAVLVSPRGAAMAVRLNPHGLPQQPAQDRKGRSAVRLVAAPPGAQALLASPRALSMLGMHWCFLMAGSAMESQRRLA